MIDTQRLRFDLIRLTETFEKACHDRGTVPSTPMAQHDAQSQLRVVSFERAGLLRVELDELAKVGQLSRERLSLLLRFRCTDADPQGHETARLISDDLNYAAQTDSYAADILVSLGSYEPLTQDEQMLDEAAGSLARIGPLIDRADVYVDQMKNPLVRGPQP